jgi:hypothetical protein
MIADFQCTCGEVKTVRIINVVNGNSKSCGCLKRETASKNATLLGTIHGLRYHPLYKIWKALNLRCYSENDTTYHRYGGRGITVCERWRESLLDFAEDMGKRPTLKHSIDRIDNEGDYSPENCKWSTPTEQANNRCNTVYLTRGDVRDTIANWARVTGINISTLRYRNNKNYTEEKLFKKQPS